MSTRPLMRRACAGVALSLLLALAGAPPAATAGQPAAMPVPVKRKAKAAEDLRLRSNSVFVVDRDTGELVVAKNADKVMPIASLTKLMTGLVVVESGLPLDEVLEIGREDIDNERHTHSRLGVGTRLRRDELLLLALMSSENRAAMALGRHFPGGRAAFIAKMNAKARALGMTQTHFADTAGLSNGSRSTARDLQHLIRAAHAVPLLRRYSTQGSAEVVVKGRTLTFVSSNRMVRRSASDWQIDLQKTGFTNEAGRCLVMHATVLGRRLMMVFLDSQGTLTRYADAARVRKQLERRGRAGKAANRPAEAGAVASKHTT